MLYHINHWCPIPGMGSSGFSIQLWPAWAEGWASYSGGLTQENADCAIKTMGREWLDAHGYDKKSEFEDRYVWEPRTSLRVSWGVWGPEHIQVPGNACGLDLSDGITAPRGGKVMLPHNVDSPAQASLLLTVFLFFAESLILDMQLRHAI